MGDGYPEDWAVTLDRLAQLDFTHIFMDHGEPAGRDWLRMFGATSTTWWGPCAQKWRPARPSTKSSSAYPSSIDPWSVQYGVEFRSPWPPPAARWRPIAAVDFQNREENNWHADFSLRAGVQFDGVLVTRNLQILLEPSAAIRRTASSISRRSTTSGWASTVTSEARPEASRRAGAARSASGQELLGNHA